MVRAVIFDCFGVLTTDGWLPFKRKHFGHDKALTERASELNSKVNAGLSAYDDFLKEIADMAGMPTAHARARIENNVANQPLFEYIAQQLKPQYKIGFLSNAAANWLDELFTPAQVGLFDEVCLSCDTGFVKPDERAFTAIARQLQLQPAECVFVDDQERYCAAARDMGMQAIVYQDFEQFRQELELILSDSKH